jgi:uncharacterized protein
LRRSEKELKSRADIDDVLNRATVCHLALCLGDVPYVVPVNYGYADNCLYIHSASAGKKLDILRHNSSVAFAMYVDERLRSSDVACNWGMQYRSVMGRGRAILLESKREKEEALRIIMRQYSEGKPAFDLSAVDKVTVIKVEIQEVTGKKSGQ